jgi:hypothetical protein
MERAFASLPLEMFLNVLDQLVGTDNGLLPIAYSSSHIITKALRALTLVSRTSYIVASRYLYANCLYLDNSTNYARFRRTIGLDLGHHPQTIKYGEAGRNDLLFREADIPRFITSLFISPMKTERCGHGMVRLPQIIDLCKTIGRTLKKLAMDLQPVYTPYSEVISVKPHLATNNIFLYMPNLEELVCSYDVSDYFPYPPPNLKRLAMTFQSMGAAYLDFCFAVSSLEVLICLRPEHLEAFHIDELFARYKGQHLDIVFVDVSANHVTPRDTRDWKDDDKITMWEVDVPKSYYGDEDDVVLCDGWIWTHGVQGTLWGQEKRRMLSWTEIEARLADPEVQDVADAMDIEHEDDVFTTM